jgi:hypothetical protein
VGAGSVSSYELANRSEMFGFRCALRVWENSVAARSMFDNKHRGKPSERAR